MKHRFLQLTAILCLIASLSLTGCGSRVADSSSSGKGAASSTLVENTNPNKSASLDIFAMDTYMTVTAYGSNGELATRKAVEEINRLDALLSTGNGESEIGKINEAQTGVLTGDTEYLYHRSMEICQMTEGAFDIAIYPVMKAWGFTDQNYHVPEKTDLESLLTLADPAKLDYDEETKTLQFSEDGMAIDFGGIAKGYTSARIMDIYRENGVSSGLVSLGGNVQTLGTKPDGSMWKIAIQNPDKGENFLGVLKIADKAVITSGGYERYFEEDGKTYHHIIDPTTGYPADSGLISVTIISEDGTLADGLSTSLFIMGKEKACSFWQQHKEKFDFILLDQNENLWISEGIEGTFSSDQYKVNVVR